MPIFDTHAHYDSGGFSQDRDAVLAALPAAGIGLVVDPGCDLDSSRAALRLAERFPHSVINVTVTATGGENSLSGAKRVKRDVLTHRPYLVTIDYGRNDMFLTEEQMRGAWTDMTTDALDAGCKVLLLTPAPDSGAVYYEENERKLTDAKMADIIREAAERFQVGLADVHGTFERLFAQGHKRSEYAASINHPNRRGHEIIADCMMEWVPYV